jgi:diguanylate cyclase (GGDEF)-like protein
MTSLKKHIDAHTEALLDATICAYRTLLRSTGKHAERAVPGLGSHLSGEFSALQDRFLSEPMPATVLKTQQAAEEELNSWANSVEQHLKSKAKEAREIMLAVAGAAQNLTSRDQKYSQRFRELTERMEEIADLEDLSQVRRSLITSAHELKADVQSMETEGQRTISGLEGKLADYRNRLAEAERRERADALTGLMNRRGIEREIEKWRAEGRNFCVVLLDLNSFKAVNDTFGHGAGDNLLTQFSGELRTQFRQDDLIGRWGGDEFIVIMNGNLNDARNCVERLRKWAFGTYKIRTQKGVCPIPVSASVGIAVWDRTEEFPQVLSRADESMYEEKRAGSSGCRVVSARRP